LKQVARSRDGSVPFVLQDNLNKNIGARKMQQDDFIYTPSSTDITVRWRKLYSYIPASEQPYYQAKWKEFRDKLSRTLEDVNPEKPEVYPFKWKRKNDR
jgi:hypothetical protein